MEFLLKYGLDNLNIFDESDVIKTPTQLAENRSEKEIYEYRDQVNMKEEIREIFKNVVVGSKHLWVNFVILVIFPIFIMFKSIQDKDISFINKILFTGGTIIHCIITSKIIGNGVI
jgi:hypothetical protein